MKTIRHLKAQKARLKAIMQRMDSEASFDSEDGRRYAQALVKLVLINMQIEETKKEAARK
ncbi:hypothetical protein [Cohnella sp.]|uniref:hypothetical protein n=1 Tax=Cohnella sp. TaxID=1883426 RepID=UPI00356228B0